MKLISSLNSVHQKGKFGNIALEDDKNILKIREIKDMVIFQIIKFKNSKIEIDQMEIDNQLIDKISKFAPIKHILKNKSEDEHVIVEFCLN